MNRLRQLLSRIDGRGYPAYKQLRGRYHDDEVELCIDHVQGDPFAAPSKVRLRIPLDDVDLPDRLLATRAGRVAVRDGLARRLAQHASRIELGRSGSGKSGVVLVDAGGQEVLERSAVVLEGDVLDARLQVGLPAAGRRILGRAAERLLVDELPRLARRALLLTDAEVDELEDHVRCVEDQEDLRRRLPELGLIAFVADGSVLPRRSGASDRPLAGDAVVPWMGPESLAVEVELLHPLPDGRRRVRGTGLSPGVTLIVGGGYHGKSTLLSALERGVYPHVPSDGRELVVTDPSALKVRAEDGRRVEGVDISPFIADLPGGRNTSDFRTDDASGSTSQAASIVEAVEVGTRVLLLDEDSSATNFLVRDARMQELVAKEHEPITPLVDRVRELHDELDVSTILVMGGCGDYFDVADRVLLMKDFIPEDVTSEARSVAERHPSGRRAETDTPLASPRERHPHVSSIDASKGRKGVKITLRDLHRLELGTSRLDLHGLEQLVDRSQTWSLGCALELLRRRFLGDDVTLSAALEALDDLLDREGLDVLDPHHREGEHPGDHARPRRFEIAGALNRLRTLRVE
ncbi:MAG: ABC-ATPase domain-containing protein [Acidobacteriota bacterium]